MGTIPNINDLLVRIRKGDLVAFYKLYNCYNQRLYHFVLRYVKQQQDAEELIQEVFIKIWEERTKIDLKYSFEGYLFTIAYNKTISLLRKKISEQKYIDYIKSVQRTNTTIDLLDEVSFNELSERIRYLLDALTPQQRLIFSLSRDQGLSNKEIAAKLNIATNTVKKHIANILKFLKSKV